MPAAPTLVPCMSCGATTLARPGRIPSACEGCGAPLDSGKTPARRERPTTRREAGRCGACGSPTRLGQRCSCEVAPRPSTGRIQANKATLAKQGMQDRAVPLAVFGISVLLAIGFQIKTLGVAGAFVVTALGVGLGTIAGLIAGYVIGGSLMGWDLGRLPEAALKLAALMAFDIGGTAVCQAVGIGFGGELVVTIAGWIMLMRFFQMTFFQALLFRIATKVTIFMLLGAVVSFLAKVL